MAILSDSDRIKTRRCFTHYFSLFRLATDLSKEEIKSAVDATDDWIDDNQVSFNNALPVLVQNSLTTTQKTLLFCAVALARTSIAFLEKAFGGID